MKKLLIVLMALAMVASGFAVSPVVDADVISLSGSASVTFGVNLENGKTGFKNAESANAGFDFVLNPAAAASTTGDGVWGELSVSLAETKGGFTLPSASISKAVIHFGALEFGIKAGGLQYGANFLVPNALNYGKGNHPVWGQESSDMFNGYNQGVTLAYTAEKFSVEVKANSKPYAALKEGEIVSTEFVGSYMKDQTFAIAKADDWAYMVEILDVKANTMSDVLLGNGSDVKALTAGVVDKADDDNYKVMMDGYIVKVEKITYKTDDAATDWSNDWAIGAYAHISPITDLNVDFGATFGLLGENKSDYTAFAGADYTFAIPDSEMRVIPCVSYTIKNEYDEGTELWTVGNSDVFTGVAFTWADSMGASVLENMFAKELKHDPEDNAATSLSGVSIGTKLNMVQGAEMKYDTDYEVNGAALGGVPLFVAVNGNGLVDGLSFAASWATTFVEKPEDVDVQFTTNQFAFAASYAVAVEDLTFTPAFGMILDVDGVSDADADYEYNQKKVQPKATLNVAGLIDNTTFDLEWSGAKYAGGFVDGEEVAVPDYTSRANGTLTLKTTISL